MNDALFSRKEFFKNFPKKIVETFETLKGDKNDSSDCTACIDVVSCLAWSGAPCQMCYLSCPRRDEAIQIWCEKPVIVASACDGCGVCQKACEAVNSPAAMKLVYDMARRNI